MPPMNRLPNPDGARGEARVAAQSFKTLDIGWQSGLLDGFELGEARPVGAAEIDALPSSGYIDPESGLAPSECGAPGPGDHSSIIGRN